MIAEAKQLVQQIAGADIDNNYAKHTERLTRVQNVGRLPLNG